MKLELKHLAPYLPYELKAKVHFVEGDLIGILDSLDLTGNQAMFLFADNPDLYDPFDIGGVRFKPYLHPLSDLTKDTITWGELGMVETFEEWSSQKMDVLEYWPYNWVQALFKHHYDVFGLIPEGLAIDINTLNKQNE